MSKIKFGNFITYKGKNLATPQAKAQDGNLVFAEITEGADQGYYIFGGVAEGHLVTMEVFNAVKKEVKELIGEGELAMPKHDDGSYLSIVEYVNGRLETLADYKVKDIVVGATSIVGENGVVTLGDAAQKNVATAIAKDSADLATAGQVFDAIDAIPEVVVAQGTGIAVGSTTADGKTTYTVSVDDTIATKTYVDEEIGKLGDVMSFIGVVETKPTDANVVLVGGSTAAANNGDVVTVQTSGEEYIWTGTEWIEIGKVSTDEAVTSAQGSTYVSVAGEGEGAQKKGDITISVVTSAIAEGATGLATAADVFEAIKVIGATGYLKVEDKNVVVDADQVQLGTTNTDAKLATKGYVDDQIAEVSSEAAKHSSVKSTTETYIGVTGVTAANGGVEYQVSLEDAALAAKNHTIEAIEIDGTPATGATTVQGALQDLFESDKVAAEGLVDLNDRLDAHIGSTEAHAAKDITYAGATGVTTTNVKDALDELYSKVDNIEVPVTSVTGDTASYSDVTTDEAGNVTVKNTLATAVDVTGVTGATAATATGLATDAWVKDYITSILAWEVLTD